MAGLELVCRGASDHIGEGRLPLVVEDGDSDLGQVGQQLREHSLCGGEVEVERHRAQGPAGVLDTGYELAVDPPHALVDLEAPQRPAIRGGCNGEERQRLRQLRV